jgi:hypothetical protein
MLKSRAISQYEERAESWHRFVFKAAKGSYKATDMLRSVEMAYMAKIAKCDAPATLRLEDYYRLFRDTFPKARPFSTVREVVELGVSHGWFPHRFAVAERPHHEAPKYQALWKRGIWVPESVLIHDAIHLVQASWSADHCMACIDEHPLDYNSLLVVAGMIYFSLIWPDDSPETNVKLGTI